VEKGVGIICEYNPFHKGHEYLIAQVKKAFPQKSVVCVMSGNFVQRGSFAVQEKYSRARCALFSGADLVLEIPFPFSSLSAESFARAAVSILQKTGCVDTLAFGSETADTGKIRACAENLLSKEMEEGMKAYLKSHPGVGYPYAREQVYTALFGKEENLSLPNFSLAAEYRMAMQTEGADFTLFPVLRKGEGVSSTLLASDFPSATAIRGGICSGEDITPHIPDYVSAEIERERAVGRFPVSMETLSSVVFYLLKTRSRKELGDIYGLAPLCDRARRASEDAGSLEELVENMRSSNFTDSRVRRALLSLLLSVPRYAEREACAFTQVLAFSKKGREILRALRTETGIPVFTKPSHALKHPEVRVRRQASFLHQADEIYAMAFPKKQESAYFLKQNPREISRPLATIGCGDILDL